MVIYNVTVIIDEDISKEWLNWMQVKHIPDVMATGKFIDGKLSRILAEEEELVEGLDGISLLSSETPDGLHVDLFVNTGLATDVLRSLDRGVGMP